MRVIASLLVLIVAACGQTSAPAPAEEPPAAAEVAAPEGEPMSAGLMGGISTSAAGDVSGLQINRDNLEFSNPDDERLSVATEYLGAIEPTTLIAEGGDSFAAAAPSDTATRVELRRLTGDAARLCGGDATYAAIVMREPLTVLQLMLFTGADAPGPTARDSAICFIAAYAVD